MLDRNEGLAVTGLLLHDRLDESLQDLAHIDLVLEKVDLIIVLNVDLKLPGVDHVTEGQEWRWLLLQILRIIFGLTLF